LILIIGVQNTSGKTAKEVCEAVGSLTTELEKAFEGFDPSILDVTALYFATL